MISSCSPRSPNARDREHHHDGMTATGTGATRRDTPILNVPAVKGELSPSRVPKSEGPGNRQMALLKAIVTSWPNWRRTYTGFRRVCSNRLSCGASMRTTGREVQSAAVGLSDRDVHMLAVAEAFFNASLDAGDLVDAFSGYAENLRLVAFGEPAAEEYPCLRDWSGECARSFRR